VLATESRSFGSRLVFATGVRDWCSRLSPRLLTDALQPEPPFAVVNASRPFRFARADTFAKRRLLPNSQGLAEEQTSAFDDETVQFAVGMVRSGDSSSVHITYGIGDCVSAARDVVLSDVSALLSGRLQLDVL
jgi:hypothetical protein